MTTIDTIHFMKMLRPISPHWCFQKKNWFQTAFVVVWYTSMYADDMLFKIFTVKDPSLEKCDE